MSNITDDSLQKNIEDILCCQSMVKLDSSILGVVYVEATNRIAKNLGNLYVLQIKTDL